MNEGIQTLYLCSPAFPIPERALEYKRAIADLEAHGYRVVCPMLKEPDPVRSSVTFATVVVARLATIRRETVESPDDDFAVAVLRDDGIRMNQAEEMEREQASSLGLTIRTVAEWKEDGR